MTNGADDPNVGEPTPTGEAAKTSRTWVWWVVGGVALVAILAFVFLASSTVAVPQTVGMTQQEATAALANASLRAGKVSEVETLAAEPGVVVMQSPSAGEEVREDTAVDLSVAAVPIVMVPDVVGESLSAADAKLAVEGLRTGEVKHVYDSKIEAGLVTEQDPAPGTEAEVAEFVNLTVSKGTEQGEVPNVIGLPSSDAESTVEAAGFEVTTIKESSDSVPAGDVSDQSPAAGVVAEAGSLVTLTVSTGADQQSAAPEDTDESSTQDESDQASKPDDTTDDSSDASKPDDTTDDSTDSSKPDEDADTSKPDDGQEPEKPSSPEVQIVSVPDVVGTGVLDAIDALRALELKVDFDFVSSSEYLLRIAAQDPAADTEVEVGTVVTVSIGLPPFLFGEEPPPTAETLPAPLPEGGSEETTTAP